jgi:hypothetical protein
MMRLTHLLRLDTGLGGRHGRLYGRRLGRGGERVAVVATTASPHWGRYSCTNKNTHTHTHMPVH